MITLKILTLIICFGVLAEAADLPMEILLTPSATRLEKLRFPEAFNIPHPPVRPGAYTMIPKRAQVNETEGPIQYDFGYSVNVPETGDKKNHQEVRFGDIVEGKYIVIDPDGFKRTVEYAADDKNGFVALVSKEPYVEGETLTKAIISEDKDSSEISITPKPAQNQSPNEPTQTKKPRPIFQNAVPSFSKPPLGASLSQVILVNATPMPYFAYSSNEVA